MARVATEMYRIENVIYVRIKATPDQRGPNCPTARLLSYAPKGRLWVRPGSDDSSFDSVDSEEPAHR